MMQINTFFFFLERDRERWGETEEERERETLAGSTPSAEPNVRLMNLRS